MTSFTPLFRALGTAALVASLAACTGTTKQVTAPPPVPKLSDILAQASQANTSGNREQAVALWKKAAAAYPKDKAPWGFVAKARHDAGLHGEAIVAAQEVLLRDPNDKAAHSILVISGLRVASKSAGDLSRINSVSGDVRVEAQELSRVIKDSLGVMAAEPPPEKPNRNPPGGKRTKVVPKPPSGTPSAEEILKELGR